MQGLDVKCSGTVKMLIDLELLAHTDYLVASDHSRWSKVLQYLRYILYGVLSTVDFSYCLFWIARPQGPGPLSGSGPYVPCGKACDARQASGIH